jgi:hypothetical protein
MYAKASSPPTMPVSAKMISTRGKTDRKKK